MKELEKMGIKDPSVLEVLKTIPRHLFIDSAFLEHAYQNKAFPIGFGQTISHPYTVAFQTELLELKNTDRVLEIGTGSGYQTCVLALLCKEVFSIERIAPLSELAQKRLDKLNLKANLVIGDGSKGFLKNAPYDKIIVTAGAPTITDELIAQLAPNGILIIPVGDKEVQNMYMIRKNEKSEIFKRKFSNFSFVPLIGEFAW